MKLKLLGLTVFLACITCLLYPSNTFAQKPIRPCNDEQSQFQLKNPWDNGSFKPNPPIEIPKFMAYPVTDKKPVFIDSNNPKQDETVYQLRLQHWYYLYQPDEYLKRYGEFPELPDGMTPEAYRQQQHIVPNEYEKIMFDGELKSGY